MLGISIVICSRNGSLENKLSENIGSTVGSQFELIVIDNSENDYSIFEAYNLGIKKSLFPYLLFVHEDVLFHTKNWGKILIEYFENNEKIGLIGLAGSKLKTDIPSS